MAIFWTFRTKIGIFSMFLDCFSSLIDWNGSDTIKNHSIWIDFTFFFHKKYQQITPLHTDSRRKTSFSWVSPIMNHRIAMNSTPLSWRNWRSLVLMACPMNQVWKFSFTWSLPIFLPRKRFSFDQFGSVWIEKPYDLDQNNNLIVRFRPNSWRVTLATMVAQLAWLKANAWKTVRSSLNRKTGFLKRESRRTSSPIQKQYDIFKSIWINFDQFQIISNGFWISNNTVIREFPSFWIWRTCISIAFKDLWSIPCTVSSWASPRRSRPYGWIQSSRLPSGMSPHLSKMWTSSSQGSKYHTISVENQETSKKIGRASKVMDRFSRRLPSFLIVLDHLWSNTIASDPFH